MSTPETTQQMVKESRAIAAGDSEPQHTEERSVIQIENSLYVNISEFATIVHDIEKGDTVKTHCVEHGVCIEVSAIEGEP